MRTFLFLLFLSITQFSCAQDWLFIGTNGAGTEYIDPATIRSTGNNFRVWILGELDPTRKINNNVWSSYVNLEEFDCKEERRRLLQGTAYSGRMASGDTIFHMGAADWTFQSPGTLGFLTLKTVCQLASKK